MLILLTLMVIGASNRVNVTLRRFGLFDREIPDALRHEAGADLAQLCAEAVIKCIREQLDFIGIEADEIDAVVECSPLP